MEASKELAEGLAAMGAKVIEKHFTLNKKDKGPDHPHSMDPQEFAQMVKRIRLLEAALGTGRKQAVEEESETVIVQRRSLYAKNDISAGKEIKKEDIIELRPALVILPKFKSIVVGRKTKRNIDAGEPLKWEDVG